jgi:predicted permease
VYVGTHRYSVTIRAFHGSFPFAWVPCVELVLLQLQRTAAIHHFAVLAFCFMPDRLHLVVEALDEGADLVRFVTLFKQYTGLQHRRDTGNHLWQEGFDDRVLREDEAAEDAVRASHLGSRGTRHGDPRMAVHRVGSCRYPAPNRSAFPSVSLSGRWRPWRRGKARMDTLWSDIRHALRTFRANPGLTAVAALSLAIGIGPNSVIFSLIDGLGFRPLPIRDASHLAVVSSATSTRSDDKSTFLEYVSIRDGTRSFSQLAASAPQGLGISGGQEGPAVVFGALVSANYFSTLGVDPILGRTFLPEEDRTAGTHPVVIIGERLWTRRFNRDPQILRRTVRLNQLDCSIVGVMPARFVGTTPVLASELWMPMMLLPALLPGEGARMLQADGRRGMSVYGRLRPESTIEQARAEVESLGRHLAESYPEIDGKRRLTVDYEEAVRRAPFVRVAAVSLGFVGLVLLIACANVAGLLLGRSEVRRNEIGVRVALGASRGRIIRQLLTESAVLSLLGGTAGLLLAWWLISLLPALVPASPITLNLDFRLDLRVLFFTLVVALAAAPVFGLTPALLASRPNIVNVLNGAPDQPRAGGRHLRTRPVLIVGQIAVSLMLLASAGLLARSYFNTRDIDPGFVVRPMVFCTMAPPVVGYGSSQTREFYQQLLERLTATPGVERASMAAHIPLNSLYGGGASQNVVIPGQPPPPGQDSHAIRSNIVAPNYFDTMGIRLVRGRDFDAGDRATSMPVIIVNQSMAQRFWPHANPIGQHVTLLPATTGGPTREGTIVGIAQDGKRLSLRETVEPALYLPYGQSTRVEMTVIARGRDEHALAIMFRRVVASFDKTMPTLQVMTMSEHLRLAVIFEQSLAAIVSAVAGVALFLSVIGLYGVIAFLVARRTREIGIRVALGARPADVVADVLKQGARFAAIGSGIGLLLAGIAGGLMGGTLYGVSAVDPLTFAAVTALVMLIALAAAWLPARRAARIDPIVALRCQ